MGDFRMNGKDGAISRLCQIVEAEVGRSMQTPKDFDYLSACIFEKQHQTMSATTLKRLWGYLPENSSPRKATLNLLSQFVGYADWEDFCRREGFTAGGDDAVDDGEPTVSRGVRRFRPFAIAAVAAVLVMLFVGGFLMKQHLSAATTAGSYVLRKGQVFSTCDDYLRLFGIYDSTNWWGRVLPHHPDIVVWGPEYHHPHWLNEGNRQH